MAVINLALHVFRKLAAFIMSNSGFVKFKYSDFLAGFWLEYVTTHVFIFLVKSKIVSSFVIRRERNIKG